MYSNSYFDRREGRSLARMLGLFSLGLGAVELLAPSALAGWLGMRGHERLIASYGARELAAGVGILASDRPRGWVWARILGDALDIATLQQGYSEGNRQRANVGIALAAVAGVTLADIVCAERLSRRSYY
jgi:hypothetical protein